MAQIHWGARSNVFVKNHNARFKKRTPKSLCLSAKREFWDLGVINVFETCIIDFSGKVAPSPQCICAILRSSLRQSLRAALYEKPRLSKSYEKLPKGFHRRDRWKGAPRQVKLNVTGILNGSL